MKAISVFLLTAVLAAAQGEKKLKDGEYDPYNEVVKDINTNNFSKALTDLDIWKQKFPESDYKDDRTAFYVQAYTATNQPAKALDEAGALMAHDLSTVFPGPAGQPTIVRLLYNAVYAISHDPNATPDAIAVGEKAARQLMAFDTPIAGVSAADWEKARASMKEQANAALLYIAMQPGVQAMAKQPPEAQQGGRSTSETTFSDLKKEIADRNEQAHKQARERREAREREQFGIVARHRLDLDR